MSPVPCTTERAIDQTPERRRERVALLGARVGEAPPSELAGAGLGPRRRPNGTGRAGWSWPGEPSPNGRVAPGARRGRGHSVEEELKGVDRQERAQAAGRPRRDSKLARGMWSWLHAHSLLKGPGDGPWDYRLIEDDYQRLARGTQERTVFGPR